MNLGAAFEGLWPAEEEEPAPDRPREKDLGFCDSRQRLARENWKLPSVKFSKQTIFLNYITTKYSVYLCM